MKISKFCFSKIFCLFLHNFSILFSFCPLLIFCFSKKRNRVPTFWWCCNLVLSMRSVRYCHRAAFFKKFSIYSFLKPKSLQIVPLSYLLKHFFSNFFKFRKMLNFLKFFSKFFFNIFFNSSPLLLT